MSPEEPTPPATSGPEGESPRCRRHPERESWIRCQRCDHPVCPDCMVPAAVGFHCPDCVREGAASVRQPQAAYGGRPSADPTLTSKVLIGINAAVWLLIMVTGGQASEWVRRLALQPLGYCLDLPYIHPGLDAAQCSTMPRGDWVAGVVGGAPWELLTSVFTHVSPMHIGFNMLALWVLGPQLELMLGRVRFLALYLISGLAGSAAVMWLSGPYSSTIGASGAIFGLMAGLMVVGFKVGGDVRQLLAWIAVNVVITVMGGSMISWQGHLGGFVGGLAVAAVLAYAPREHRARWQWLGLALVLAAIAAAVVVRAMALTSAGTAIVQ